MAASVSGGEWTGVAQHELIRAKPNNANNHNSYSLPVPVKQMQAEICEDYGYKESNLVAVL